MHTRVVMPLHLQALAARQAGVIHNAQLTELPAGAVRRLRGEWVRLANGLFCLNEPTFASAVWAGLLRAGPNSVVGGAAAAHIHGLLHTAPQRLSVWVPNMSKPSLMVGSWVVAFRRGDRRGIGTPRRTNVEDTVLDSAAELGEDSLIAVATRALADRRTTAPRLLSALSARQRLRHRHAIGELCSAAGEGIESVLEWRYLQRVEERHHLPALERQEWLGEEARLDGLYREFALAIELDGRSFHDAAQDMSRDNRHALKHDVTTLRYGWTAVTEEPCAVAAQVAQALQTRGWIGQLRPCPDCPSS